MFRADRDSLETRLQATRLRQVTVLSPSGTGARMAGGPAAHSLPLVHKILLQSGRAERARVRICGMAMAETDDAKTADRFRFRTLAVRLQAWRDDDSDRSIALRIASGAFLIRVASAVIIYLSQVLLARWMGRFEFGIYVYVWAWVGFLGMLSPIGIAYAAQRFIPEYRARGDDDGLRGFLRGSRRRGARRRGVAARRPHPGLLRRAVHDRQPRARDLRGELHPGFDRPRLRSG